jgi:hypothetical protein
VEHGNKTRVWLATTAQKRSEQGNRNQCTHTRTSSLPSGLPGAAGAVGEPYHKPTHAHAMVHGRGQGTQPDPLSLLCMKSHAPAPPRSAVLTSGALEGAGVPLPVPTPGDMPAGHMPGATRTQHRQQHA